MKHLKFGLLLASTCLVATLAVVVVLGVLAHSAVIARADGHTLAFFTIEKAAGTAHILPDQPATFALTVSAGVSGTLAEQDLDVLITESLPSGVRLVAASAPYTLTGDRLQWRRTLSTGVGYRVVTFGVRLARSNLVPGTPIANRDYRARSGPFEARGEPVTITVARAPGVAITPATRSLAVTPGRPLALPYTLTNAGNLTDTISVTARLSSTHPLTGWQITLPASVTLAAGESASRSVALAVGGTTPTGTLVATLILTATSSGGAAPQRAYVYLDARPARLYLPLMVRNYPPQPVITSLELVPARGGPGYAYVAPLVVHIEASFEDGSDTLQDVSLSHDGRTWGAWTAYSPILPYTLTDGSGYKTVHVRVRGGRGGVARETASITLLENGDFGDVTALKHWQPGLGSLPEGEPDGDRALLGDTEYLCHPVLMGEAILTQTIDLSSVPPGHRVVLHLDYEIWTEDKLLDGDYDRFVVLVDGQELYRDGYQGSESFGCSSPHTLTRIDHQIDLSAYQGQVIVLLLGNYSHFDDWYNTHTYVDNVRIIVD